MWCVAMRCDAMSCVVMQVFESRKEEQERQMLVDGAGKQGRRVEGRVHSAQVQVDLR